MNKPLRLMTLVTAIMLTLSTIAFSQASVGFGRRPQPSLTVTSNVQGANVLINNELKGTTPATINLANGVYIVAVQARGYIGYRARVTVNGPTTINVTLQPINYSLSITASANGAVVFINGRRMGRAPYTARLAPGTYELRVTAGGYVSFSTQVVVNQDTSINARLEPLLAVVHVRIPDEFLNVNSTYGRGNKRRAENDIRVFVDGRRMNRNTFRLREGTHRIRFESGSFTVQQSFSFNGGQSYIVSPELSIRVK